MVVSSTRPEPAALFGSISPEPWSKTVAAVLPSSLTTFELAVSISSDFSSAGESVGCACVSSAAAPATCGEAIEVPWIAWNRKPGRSSVVGVGWSAAPARICTPGATTSGFGRSGTAPCGPREENAAITRSCAVSALPAVSAAVIGPRAIASLTRLPSVKFTCAVGTQWVSVSRSAASVGL